MSVDGAINIRRDHTPAKIAGNNGNINGGVTIAAPPSQTHRLRLTLNPNTEHKPDSYDDVSFDDLQFSPLLFSCLERYLPQVVMASPREAKVEFMRDVLLKYSPKGERDRVRRHKEYRQKIIGNYQPLHKELYSLQASNFFVPSFLKAIHENTEESFRSIMKEPQPGVFTFEILQPQYCELLVKEVEHFEQWVCDANVRIMRPNIMNKFGAVLDDFGLESMLDKLMEDFVRPLSKVFYPEVGGATLDSHHGFVVEYGIDKDVDLGFHVDDAEVTLNICLGKQFSGGELFFRGVRCDNHVNTETHPDEILDYSHTPGRAVLHRGRHRHGARATTEGHRVNLILWCRSSVFRELKKYQKDFSSWCGECQREKKERQQLSISATKEMKHKQHHDKSHDLFQELLKKDVEPGS